MKLESKIEAILFYIGDEMSIRKIASILDATENDVDEALQKLEVTLQERGLSLVRKEKEVMLTTSSSVSHIIEKLTKEELSGDLGKAGLETLAIVLYREQITRSEIDYVRGVNSSFILRNLLIRGLVERMPNPKDNRGFIYKPTFQLLQHLGVTSLAELPNKEKVLKEMESFQNQKHSTEADNKSELS